MESSPGAMERALREAKVIAVVGAHTEPARPAHYVPATLSARGFRVLPVNARLAGEALFGQTVAGRLDALREPVDLVLFFRRSEDLMGHLDEVLAMRPPPRWVWLQSGIRDAAFAARLVAAGMEVIQDRCMMVEHNALRG